MPTAVNVNSLRAFRALRPLRTLKRIPGMPHLVQWVLDVLPKMADVVLLCAFIWFVFGIVGMELFKGTLHNRCAMPGFRSGLTVLEQFEFDTGVNCNPALAGDCAHSAVAGATCEYFDSNPHYGTMSFDSVALSGIALIEAMTLDDWSAPMYSLMDAVSPYVWLYFVPATLLSGFFVVNFFLAVIYLEYGATGDRLASEARTARKAAASAVLATEEASLLPRQTLLSDAPTDGGGVERSERSSMWSCPPMEGTSRKALSVVMNSEAMQALTTGLVVLNMVRAQGSQCAQELP